MLLGFAAAFRRSDLVALDLADVDLSADRLTLSLQRGKTDQEGRGRQLVIPRANRVGLCPVRALAAWLEERGRWPGPLFCQVSKKDVLVRERMRAYEVRYALVTSAGLAGLDATKFGAHSLRAGFVTAAADAGADVFDIMNVTGHKSVENLGMYVRRSVSRYPLRAAL